jgi:ribosome-associated translation inhibitor RaiA
MARAIERTSTMHVETAGKGFTSSPELRGHANLRLHAALQRFAHRIVLIRVRLETESKTGAISAHVQVTADRLPPLNLEAGGPDALTALDKVADKAGHQFARTIERAWSAPRTNRRKSVAHDHAAA